MHLVLMKSRKADWIRTDLLGKKLNPHADSEELSEGAHQSRNTLQVLGGVRSVRSEDWMGTVPVL